MNELQIFLKKVTKEDQYIHCSDAITLLANTHNSTIEDVARLLLALFFHVEMAASSYEKNKLGFYFKKMDCNITNDDALMIETLHSEPIQVTLDSDSIEKIYKNPETYSFLEHIINFSTLNYQNFSDGCDYDFNLHWHKKTFFDFCNKSGLLQTSDEQNLTNTNNFDSDIQSPSLVVPQLIPSIEQLHPRRERTLLNIIGAMKEIIINDINTLPSQNKLIERLTDEYHEYEGISKTTLEKVFADAKKNITFADN